VEGIDSQVPSKKVLVLYNYIFTNFKCIIIDKIKQNDSSSCKNYISYDLHYVPLKSCHALITDLPFNITDPLQYHKIPKFVEGIENLTIYGQYIYISSIWSIPPKRYISVRITSRRFIPCLCHIVVCPLITWVGEGSTLVRQAVCNPIVLWVPRIGLEEREALRQDTTVLHTLSQPDTCM